MASPPVHHWNSVLPSEVFTLAAFAGLAYWVALVGIARSRRGERPFSLGLAAWLDRILDRAPSVRNFRTPSHAQSWYVGRSALLMPVGVLWILAVGLVIWSLASRNPTHLVEGMFIGSRLLMGLAVIGGAVMGHVGPADDLAIGQFLATRPMTSADMSRSILRVAAISLLGAWAVWAAALAAIWLTLTALGANPAPFFPKELDWRELPGSFLGSWVILGGVISTGLTGRSKPATRLWCGLVTGGIGLMLVAKFGLSPAAQAQLLSVVASAVGVLSVAGTAWAFAVARWRRLVETPMVWTALAVGAALLTGGAILFPPGGDLPPSFCLLLAGAFALAIAPLATAPLALRWNRHR
jgi:hypothetical protein